MGEVTGKATDTVVYARGIGGETPVARHSTSCQALRTHGALRRCIGRHAVRCWQSVDILAIDVFAVGAVAVVMVLQNALGRFQALLVRRAN